MDYNSILTALSFLDEKDRIIVLQVPYQKDIKLVKEYILSTWGNFRVVKFNTLINKDCKIIIESVYSEQASYGYNYPTFFIDRKRDRSYYDWIEM